MVAYTTNFDNVTGTTSKNIKFSTMHAFMAYEKEVWGFCKKLTTDQKYEQFLGYEGFGATPELAESGDITTVDYKEGYKTTVPQKQFGYEVRVSWLQRRVAKANTGFTQQIGFFLGRSGGLRYDYKGADIINNGYTDSAAYHGGDGKPLFSATHPWKMGGTYSNVLTSAALSKTAIQAGVKTVHNTKMENNIPAKLKITNIQIGYENVLELPEILKSTMDPDSSNRRDNALADLRIGRQVSHFVSDTDGWTIYTDRSFLALVELSPPFLTTETYPNKDIGENLFMSFNSMHKEPLATFGNAG